MQSRMKNGIIILAIAALIIGSIGCTNTAKGPSINENISSILEIGTTTASGEDTGEDISSSGDGVTTEDSATTEENTTTESVTTTEPETTTQKPTEKVTTTKKETTTKKVTNTESQTTVSSVTPIDYVQRTFPTPNINTGITSSASVEYAVSRIIDANVRASMSTIEKIKILHDYLVYTVNYDVEGLARYHASGGDWDVFDPSVFEAEGALVKKLAVCQGYARAFSALLDGIGVRNFIVYGDAATVSGTMSHAWNLVYLDGNWYHVDVTFDDPSNSDGTITTDGSNIQYNYFMVPESIITRDHMINKTTTLDETNVVSSYPTAVNSSVYMEYVLPWIEITSANDISAKVKPYFDNGIYTVRLSMPISFYESESQRKAMMDEIVLYAFRRKGGSWSTTTSVTITHAVMKLTVYPRS